MAKYESLRGLFTATADAIRAKTGGTDVIVAEDFPEFIEGIEPVIEPLTITENGTYTAPDGVDGYSPVTVDVKGSGEELVITDFSYYNYNGVRLNTLDKLDTSNCTNFSHMFACGNGPFDVGPETIPAIDTSSGKNFSYMFNNCSQITTIPELDTSNGTNFTYMFTSCDALTTIPELDTSNGINFNYMFSNCLALTTIPELDTSNSAYFSNMFRECQNLISIPELNTSKGTDFSYMFYNCRNLATIPELDTSRGTKFNYMFSGCSALTTISKIDMLGCTDYKNNSDMLKGCSALQHLYLYNIFATIRIGSGTSWGHLLTVDSLVHTIKELRTRPTHSSATLTIGSANLEKIAGLYCRITDDTNEKKPMELCESTDEGAMTLVDYASEKNWLIQ